MPQEAIVCYQRAVQTRPNSIAYGKFNCKIHIRKILIIIISFFFQIVLFDMHLLLCSTVALAL